MMKRYDIPNQPANQPFQPKSESQKPAQTEGDARSRQASESSRSRQHSESQKTETSAPAQIKIEKPQEPVKIEVPVPAAGAKERVTEPLSEVSSSKKAASAIFDTFKHTVSPSYSLIL